MERIFFQPQTLQVCGFFISVINKKDLLLIINVFIPGQLRIDL